MEISDLAFHPYELIPKSEPNRLATSAPRRGCLIRARFRELPTEGYADLFPWPELGDEPLSLQLEALKDGASFRQSAASIAWAHYEALAAQNDMSLITDASCGSHVTLLDRSNIPAGFNTAKLKISNHDIHHWNELETFMLKFPQMLWRLDFNGLFFTMKEAEAFWTNVSDSIKPRIEFLEDPYSAELMADPIALSVFAGTDIAVDRQPTAEALELAQIWVIKPVYFSPNYLFNGAKNFLGKMLITSNMDHPLGQLIALHATQNMQALVGNRLLPGGLLTQDLYSTHLQKNWVKQRGDCLVATKSGVGWGVRKELQALEWVNS